jgi:hypothetical protein
MRLRARATQRPATLLAAAAVLAVIGLAAVTSPAHADEPIPERPFEPVFEGIVAGDLVLTGATNVLSTSVGSVPIDVDDDTTRRCDPVGPAQLCVDNASGARLDLPLGARIIAARLYVDATLPAAAGPLAVRLDDPSPGFAYRTLPDEPAAGRSPKLYEVRAGAELRHAVWDVTADVAAAGAGRYTVADIVYGGTADRPIAAWSMVAAYELDRVQADRVADAERPRFATRQLSWYDGVAVVGAGSPDPLDVTVAGVDLPAGASTFGKSLHVVAGGRPGRTDNLLFDGDPIGNNSLPGDAPPPGDVTLGRDSRCNTQTDVFNGSRCILGSTVAIGSGVDVDVVRIPDRYLRAAGPRPVVRIEPASGEVLAPSVVAVSIDVPGGAP